jgi:hypothetical protein
LSLEFICLSFFKENKIQYFLDKQQIIFPCLICRNSVSMETVESKWRCSNCNRSGNIFTLNELVNELLEIDIPFTYYKVYNPRKEKNEINHRLKQISKRMDNDRLKNEIEVILEKVKKLINYYYEKNKSK